MKENQKSTRHTKGKIFTATINFNIYIIVFVNLLNAQKPYQTLSRKLVEEENIVQIDLHHLFLAFKTLLTEKT